MALLPDRFNPRTARLLAPALMVLAGSLSGCASLGSIMSPYPEKFSCKNPDHGQCIHPEDAYEDARAGRKARSDPAVTNDRKLLRDSGKAAGKLRGSARDAAGAFAGYRDSVYRELQGLIEAPVTPMLKSGETVRTLILPYADRQRPDRLFMPRYVYSILERPTWVVGGYLVKPLSPAAQLPVLGQIRERPVDGIATGGPGRAEAMPASETGR
ncbi:TraV family lipoprotein [Novosphingobium malaysiense]|uniref:Conjugal transfer protein TraV n=1 Tax=Novosphingobium malaysiense TaxID=1348853 RepID=A0A0B1ZI16_9SPHN|nr:TraV family lipoprotein [Novosphingobium malaysiense]KHK88938.1 conjugal transfer protein TraV [Novosphingobium malaysiense]